MNRDTERVYRSGPRPPKQLRFASRERSARPRRSAGQCREGLLREQSTLTQLDFCTPTPRDLFETVDDVEEPSDDTRRGERKRKRSRQQRQQTTMTQFYSSFETVASDEELGMEDDRIVDSFTESPECEKHETRRTNPVKVERISQTPSICDISPQRPRKLVSTPTIPMTPVKVYKHEIPSSQTPQSILLSERSRRDLYSPQRSPLKEKSTNVLLWSQVQERTSQSPVKRTEKSPELPDISPRKRVVFHKPAIPKLRPVETIPDSEDNPTLQSPVPQQKKVRNVVQDSQFESLGEELLLDDEDHRRVAETQRPARSPRYLKEFSIAETQFETQGADLHEEETDDEDDTCVYYDPACSALDRDAARFMQTQRLLNTHQLRQLEAEWHPEIVFQTVEPARSSVDAAHEPVNLNDNEDTGSVRTHSITPTPELEDHGPAIVLELPDNIETIDLTSTPPPPPISSSKTSTPIQQVRVAGLKAESIHSSPPPFVLPVPSSQATTVDMTQLPRSSHFPRRDSIDIPNDNISSSPLPHNPSSPHYQNQPFNDRRSSFSLYTSDSLLRHHHDDHDFSHHERPSHQESTNTKRERQQEMSASRKRLKRAKEMLPDSLLDFSFPPTAPDMRLDYSLPVPSSDWRKCT